MVYKIDVPEQKLKFKGLFDFREIYAFMYNWFKDEKNFSVVEEKYDEKISGESKEIEFKWKATKGYNEYIKQEIKINVRILGMKSVEAQKDGKRVNLNDGAFEVKASGTVLKDPENKWEKAPHMRFVRDVYDKYIVNATIEDVEGKLQDTMDDFLAQVKAFLTLEGKRR